MKFDFDIEEDDYIIMPNHWIPDSFHTITFSGWNEFTYEAGDPVLDKMTELASKTLKCFIDINKDNFFFTQPVFNYKFNGTFEVKIGVCNKKDYTQRIEKGNGLG